MIMHVTATHTHTPVLQKSVATTSLHHTMEQDGTEFMTSVVTHY